jgi:hypothetical protein
VLVVVVDGEAQVRRHRFSGRTQPTTFFGHTGGYTASEGEVEFARATVEDGRAEARFTSPDKLNATRLPIEDVQRPYDCPEPAG